MLRTVRDLQRCSIADREGEVGSLYDVFFDNRRWVVRWFVLERRVAGGHVLLSPAVVNNIDWGALSIELDLTRDHIDNPERLETRHSIFSVLRQQASRWLCIQRPELYALLGQFRGAPERIAARR